MANHINKGQLGETRLSNIHPRVEYLMYQDVDDDNLKQFYYKPLCEYCEMKLDMSGGKRGDDVEVTPNCKTLFIQCSGVGWLCRARKMVDKYSTYSLGMPWSNDNQEDIQHDSSAYPEDTTTKRCCVQH